jgi:hypothetical protein
MMFGANVTVAVQVGQTSRQTVLGLISTASLLLWVSNDEVPACPYLQDPSYPVYVDTSVMMGMTGGHNGTGFDNIEYMVCRPENDFFPDLSKVMSGGSGTPSGSMHAKP